MGGRHLMFEERIVDLIQRNVDGELEESERIELQAHLERDPDARMFLDQMHSVSEFLERAPLNDPPPEFTADVMRAVRAHAANPQSGKVVRGAFGQSRDRFIAVKIGLGLAAVIALAFILTPSLFHSLDSSRLGGSMLDPARGGAAQTWTVAADSLAPVRVAATGNHVTVRIDAPGDTERTADLEFDPSSMKLERVSEGTRVESNPGHIHVSVRGGSAVVTLVRTTTEPVSMTVSIGGDDNASVVKRIEIPAATNF